MIVRKQDVNGDMVFGQGVGNFYVNQPEGVAQAVSTVLKLFQGEWFLDSSIGVPYNTKILGFGNIPFFDSIIQDSILNTTGVLDIATYYSFVDNKRNTIINATIDTIYGQVTITPTL